MKEEEKGGVERGGRINVSTIPHFVHVCFSCTTCHSYLLE